MPDSQRRRAVKSERRPANSTTYALEPGKSEYENEDENEDDWGAITIGEKRKRVLKS
jgi:hypothetical protein